MGLVTRMFRVILAFDSGINPEEPSATWQTYSDDIYKPFAELE
jgi:hypothetical protein